MEDSAERRWADAHRDAALLYDFARGQAAVELRRAGVAPEYLRALETRASAVPGLASRRAGLGASMAANRVLDLTGELYATLGDPAASEACRLEYLEREIALRSAAGQVTAVHAAVGDLSSVWGDLRGRAIAAAEPDLAAAYDVHVAELARHDGPASVREQVPIGLGLLAAIDEALAPAGRVRRRGERASG